MARTSQQPKPAKKRKQGRDVKRGDLLPKAPPLNRKHKAIQMQLTIRALARMAYLWERRLLLGAEEDASSRGDANLLDEVRRAVELRQRKLPTVEGDEDHAATDLQAMMVALSRQVAIMLEARKRRDATHLDSGLLDELHGVVAGFGFPITRDQVGARVRAWLERRLPDAGEREETKKECIKAFGGTTNFAVSLVGAMQLIPGTSAGSLFERKGAYKAAASQGTRAVTYRELSLFMLACLDVPRSIAVPIANLLATIHSGRAAFGSDQELTALKQSLKHMVGTPGRRLSPVAFVPESPED